MGEWHGDSSKEPPRIRLGPDPSTRMGIFDGDMCPNPTPLLTADSSSLHAHRTQPLSRSMASRVSDAACPTITVTTCRDFDDCKIAMMMTMMMLWLRSEKKREFSALNAVCEDRFCFTSHKTFQEICNIAQFGRHVDHGVDSFIIGQ